MELAAAVAELSSRLREEITGTYGPKLFVPAASVGAIHVIFLLNAKCEIPAWSRHKAFVAACRNGRFDVAAMLRSQAGGSLEFVKYRNGIKAAYESGNAEMAKRVRAELYKLKQERTNTSVYEATRWAVCGAMAGGHFELASAIAKTEARPDFVLALAAKIEGLDVVRGFALPIDFREYAKCAFARVCGASSPTAAAHIAEFYNLAPPDMVEACSSSLHGRHARPFPALCRAAKHGNVDVMRWLKWRVVKASPEPDAEVGARAYSAAVAPNTETEIYYPGPWSSGAQEESSPFTNNLLSGIEAAVAVACARQQLDSVRWLVRNFRGASGPLGLFLVNACRHARLEEAQWIYANFSRDAEWYFDLPQCYKAACEGFGRDVASTFGAVVAPAPGAARVAEWLLTLDGVAGRVDQSALSWLRRQPEIPVKFADALSAHTFPSPSATTPPPDVLGLLRAQAADPGSSRFMQNNDAGLLNLAALQDRKYLADDLVVWTQNCGWAEAASFGEVTLRAARRALGRGLRSKGRTSSTPTVSLLDLLGLLGDVATRDQKSEAKPKTPKINIKHPNFSPSRHTQHSPRSRTPAQTHHFYPEGFLVRTAKRIICNPCIWVVGVGIIALVFCGYRS